MYALKKKKKTEIFTPKYIMFNSLKILITIHFWSKEGSHEWFIIIIFFFFFHVRDHLYFILYYILYFINVNSSNLARMLKRSEKISR